MNRIKGKIFYFFLAIIFVINCTIVYQNHYKVDEDDSRIMAFTEAEILEKHKDLGNTKVNEVSKVVFEIKNVGSEDLFVEDVKVDCHCTVVDWKKTFVNRNQKAILTVSYDNHIRGDYKRVVVVKANLPNSPLVLTFSGKTI